RGQQELGTRTELKNLNSFRFVEKAINFEIERQIEVLEDGGSIVQETRLYDSDRDETRPMRSKEEANDYRYFPDPDLLPVEIEPAFIEEVRASLPELPQAKRERFIEDYKIKPDDADVLTQSRALADYFEAAAAAGKDPRQAANWVLGDLSAALNRDSLDIEESRVTAAALGGLLQRISDNTISGKIAKEVFDAMWQGEGDADAVIAARGLKQITDSSAIDKIVVDVIAANPEQVADFRAGKEKILGYLVGQVMQASRGKANPAQVNESLLRKLRES
ncbi:MAG: Asp-tRNA(Asn)/Glu-tRNA(Gln) amidotransferase GatCAB subunit B, partial [Woeseia sp.]